MSVPKLAVALLAAALLPASAAEGHTYLINGKKARIAVVQSCPQQFTSQDYKAYASRVYKRKRVSRKAHAKLRQMHICQPSFEARKRVGKLHERFYKQRVRRRALATNPKAFAFQLLRQRGQASQYNCLVALWQRESGWNVYADNPTSDAYGIPQALPGSKMGPGWETDFRVQVRWGISYVNGRYGGPCNANSFQLSNGWY